MPGEGDKRLRQIDGQRDQFKFFWSGTGRIGRKISGAASEGSTRKLVVKIKR